MGLTVAVAGKGGTGKTTVAALLIQLLAKKGSTLAIDADPSVNLHLALGLPAPETIGVFREEMLNEVRQGALSGGVSKYDYIETRINQVLLEARGFDLLAMGRPEGPGCYCAANHMLRTAIDRLAGAYEYVVIDNEAGMEHISRQTTRDVDILCLVSDLSIKGIVTAGRMQGLIKDLRSGVKQKGLLVNKARGELSAQMQQAITDQGLELWALLPADDQVAELDSTGRPAVELPADSPLRLAIEQVAVKLRLF